MRPRERRHVSGPLDLVTCPTRIAPATARSPGLVISFLTAVGIR